MDLQGKVAIVTGAARGLGKCMVKTLLSRGVKVCFCDVNSDEAQKTLAECVEKFGKSNVMFKYCDICKESDIRDLCEASKAAFQKIDFFVNNAAIVDEDNWSKMLDVNLGGYIRGTTVALEFMRKDKEGNGGAIINVSSLSGYTPAYMAPVYSASKHGIIGYSRSMAMQREVIDNAVRIACLCPNMIDTPLFHKVHGELTGRDHDIVSGMVKDIGLLSMDAVAEGLIKLLQDKENNGEVLYVDSKFGINYKTYDDPVSQRFYNSQIQNI